MNKYLVGVLQWYWDSYEDEEVRMVHEVEVEAENKEEAGNKALEEVYSDLTFAPDNDLEVDYVYLLK